MAHLILDDGTTYEVTGFGTPLKDESYIRWDEDTLDGPLVGTAAMNHDSDATPRLLLKKVDPVQIIKRVGAQDFEILGLPADKDGLEDAYVRQEGDGWTADLFASDVENADEAYRSTDEYATLGEALHDLLPVVEPAEGG